MGYLVVGFLAPLQNLTVMGLNLTWFDCAMLGLLLYQMVSGTFYLIPLRFYWLISASLIVSGLFATVFSQNPMPSLAHIIQWIYILVVIIPVTYSVFLRQRSGYLFFVGILLGSVSFVLYSSSDILSANANYIGGRYAGLLGGPQPTAFLLSWVSGFIMPAFLYMSFGGSLATTVLKSTIASVLGLTFLLIFYTASRTGMLVVAVVLAVALSMMGRRSGNSASPGCVTKVNQRRCRCAAAVILVVSFGASLCLPQVSSFVFGPTEKILYRLNLSLDSESSTIKGRMDLFSESLPAMSVRAISLGYGFENYVLTPYGSKKPHNVVVLYLLEGGILFVISLLLFLGFFCYLLKKLWTLRCSFSDKEKLYFLSGIMSLAFVIIVGMFNTSIIARPYWLGFGVVLAIYVKARAVEAVGRPARSSEKRVF